MGSGEYPMYLGIHELPSLIQQRPMLILDEHFLSVAHADVEDDASREALLTSVLDVIRDLLWLVDDAGAQATSDWKGLLARAASSLELFTGWRI